MTKDTPRPRPAWEAQPGAWVTLLDATPGTLRTDANGVQWWLDDGHHWQPVVHKPEPEREAG
jgi:hypothetical protein